MPDVSTEVALATTTVSNSTTTSVTFSGISSAYTDLRIVVQYGAVSSMYLGMRLNGDTATNYSSTRMIANGSTVTTSNSTSQT